MGAKRKVSPKFAGGTPATPIFWTANQFLGTGLHSIFRIFAKGRFAVVQKIGN